MFRFQSCLHLGSRAHGRHTEAKGGPSGYMIESACHTVHDAQLSTVGRIDFEVARQHDYAHPGSIGIGVNGHAADVVRSG